MARKKDTTAPPVGELMLIPFDGKMAKVIEEVMALAREYPEILWRIGADQTADAKEAKAMRLADTQWLADRQQALEGLELPTRQPLDPQALELGTGRPRMQPRVVLLFLTLRGYYGDICSQDTWERLVDSSTVRYYLAECGATAMPGQSTILENLNVLSHATLDFMLRCQLKQVANLELDDFGELTIDSTHAESASAWPSDSSIILKLLNRAYELSQRLELFDAPNFRPWYCPRWLRLLKNFAFEIDLTSKKSGKPHRKAYKSFLEVADKLINYLGKEFDRLNTQVLTASLCPSRRQLLGQHWGTIENKLTDALTIVHVAQDRVLNGNKVKREEFEKVYSVSDPGASFITKGGRETVFGYRPQLGRSANGFVSAVIVPKGNKPDSIMLEPMVNEHVRQTSVIPRTVSTDDGYANEPQRNAVFELGVKAVSISGGKGRRMTTDEDWNSDLYKDLRRTRSAVESLMFTGKFHFDFGAFHRCGVENAQCEMLEKVIAHNLWRIVHEKEKRRQAESLAA